MWIIFFPIKTPKTLKAGKFNIQIKTTISIIMAIIEFGIQYNLLASFKILLILCLRKLCGAEEELK